MRSKSKVKVIKRREAVLSNAALKPERESGKKSARKMVNNVSNWVNELQKRKRAETKEAFDKLFPANPQTDSA